MTWVKSKCLYQEIFFEPVVGKRDFKKNEEDFSTRILALIRQAPWAGQTITLPELSRVFNFTPLLHYLNLRRRNFPPNLHQNPILTPKPQPNKKGLKTQLFLTQATFPLR
ncbi:hypothetical protein CEE35_09005 [Candidatus Aerophobetes bacterium Ae_b3b]|nr:MAG: hypothetical protein CEE35_09005 [Candidatus Aerophobetes bacterium Ae_b3b]